MFETLTQADGVGLAAPQIGRDIRVVVIDLDVLKDDMPEYADFRKAYDAFIKSPTPENAKKLKNLYEDTKDKGTFKSYARLYESHKKEIYDALQKKSA